MSFRCRGITKDRISRCRHVGYDLDSDTYHYGSILDTSLEDRDEVPPRFHHRTKPSVKVAPSRLAPWFPVHTCDHMPWSMSIALDLSNLVNRCNSLGLLAWVPKVSKVSSQSNEPDDLSTLQDQTTINMRQMYERIPRSVFTPPPQLVCSTRFFHSRSTPQVLKQKFVK